MVSNYCLLRKQILNQRESACPRSAKRINRPLFRPARAAQCHRPLFRVVFQASARSPLPPSTFQGCFLGQRARTQDQASAVKVSKVPAGHWTPVRVIWAQTGLVGLNWAKSGLFGLRVERLQELGLAARAISAVQRLGLLGMLAVSGQGCALHLNEGGQGLPRHHDVTLSRNFVDGHLGLWDGPEKLVHGRLRVRVKALRLGLGAKGLRAKGLRPQSYKSLRL